jgi:acetylornithine deacetylase
MYFFFEFRSEYNFSDKSEFLEIGFHSYKRDKNYFMIQYQEYIELLELLISIPSYSGNEEQTADCIADFLQKKEIIVERYIHNIYARNSRFSEDLPTLLLNSHQ